MNDYSQHGEGKELAKLFNSKGVLVSLGENDGKTLSNVLGFIEQGWTGYLVEPSKEAFKRLSKLHYGNTNVKLFNYAIGTENGEIDFYESDSHLSKDDVSLVSTIKPEELKRWSNTQVFTTSKCKVKTYESFRREAGFKKVDLISIDCEGVDFEIIKQLNLDNYKVIIVEHNGDNTKFDNYLCSFDVVYNNGTNSIYKARN